MAPRSAISSRSNLRLAAEFDDAVRRNAEEIGRGQRVAVHDLEQLATEAAEP
jgi:hypothetical protein